LGSASNDGYFLDIHCTSFIVLVCLTFAKNCGILYK